MQLCRIMLFIAAVMCCLYPPVPLRAEPSPQTAESGYSAEAVNWAIRWINDRLALLMEEGLVTRIIPSKRGDSYDVFVSSAWQLLTAAEKGTLLKDFSRARQITGHSPHVVVKWNEGGQMLAEVNRQGVFLYGGEEESFFPVSIE